ncbi:SAM-dependent methyltransferase [Halobacteriales archaeon QS_1_68_20]|nr:MAG: SAM-dependent methyltransferase [Halobacteriales archaeon QS_1_68_20]
MDRTDLATEELLLLWAARETGALAALTDDADDPAAVAAAAGITEHAAELVVDVLAARGFLAQVDGAYEPTNRLLGFLASADLRSVGTLPDALDAVDALTSLPETMTTGEPPESGDLVHRLGARVATPAATVRAVVTAAVREASDAERVLTVGNAPGTVAEEFVARGYAVTLADEADAIEAATPLLATTPVETVALDAEPASDELTDALPGGFDLVFAADTTRRNDPAANRRLVSRLADALAPGGTVVLVDLLADRSERATPAAVEALARYGGGVYDEAEVTDLFTAAGLDATVREIPGEDRVAVVGRR